MAWDGLMELQGAHSQKEGHDDKGEAIDLGGSFPAVLKFPGPPGLLLVLGSLAVHQATVSSDQISLKGGFGEN